MSTFARLAGYGLGSLESWEAVQRARAKYPGVTKWTVDHTGNRAVARPASA